MLSLSQNTFTPPIFEVKIIVKLENFLLVNPYLEDLKFPEMHETNLLAFPTTHIQT